jgi:hypothetical protein
VIVIYLKVWEKQLAVILKTDFILIKIRAHLFWKIQILCRELDVFNIKENSQIDRMAE